MPKNNGYRILTTVHSNESREVYKAVHLDNENSVIIKLLKQEHRDDSKINQFLNEQKILTRLSSKNIPKLLDTVSTPRSFFHSIEDISADSLYNILLNTKFDLSETLYIALEIAKTVEYLHHNGIIHTDLNPKNIIYNPLTKSLQIIDFGLSIIEEEMFLNKELSVNSSANLFYMSPEQTGLTPYEIDYRSDIYSLGMTLHHLFLGEVPFKASDKESIIHKQIVKTPDKLHIIDSTIPKVISDIISKMIEKKPMQRYQNIEAIVYDLKMCIKGLNKSNQIEYFKIATQSRPVLELSEYIFGREKELSALKQLCNRTIYHEQIKLLIHGESGVGKTRLADEFLDFFDTSNFNLLRGKFDQYKTFIPYLCFKQMFSQLNMTLMSKEYERLKDNILPESARTLHSIFPELRKVFNFKLKHDNTPNENVKNQLSFAINDFFTNIATKDHPLVIFIDDIQWIDQASSDLIINTILKSKNPYLHFATAYRDDSISDNQYALQVIDSLRQNHSNSILDIKLLNLKNSDVNFMLKSLLNIDDKELSSLIYKKTAGNPLYLKTFIEYLLDDNGLKFENGRYQYSIKQIKSYGSTLNIAEILNKNFLKLNSATQQYLQYLSILGSNFNFKLALDIMQYYGHNNQLMKQIINDGFIDIQADHYQFAHDNIQRFIYDSITEYEKQQIHFNIGMYLQHEFEKDIYNDTISVATHLNRGYDIDKLPKKLFYLNILALNEMLKNNSYKLAFKKAKWVHEHVYSDDIWKTNRSHAFLYHTIRVKIFYYNAKLNEAYSETNKLIKLAKNIHEKMICFSLLKDICVTQGKNFKHLIEVGNELLINIGLDVPLNDKMLRAEVDKLDKKISAHHLFHNPLEIIQLKHLNNKKIGHISALLVEYWEAAYYESDIALMQWSYLNIINYSFHNGNSSESTFGYVLYGAQLVSQKEYKKAQLFGDVALKLNKKINDKTMLPKIHNFVANFINPYTKPLHTNLTLYEKSLYQSKINGDIVFGTWANYLLHFSDFLSGESLEKLLVNIKDEKDFILNSGDDKMIAIFNILCNSIEELQYANIDNIKEKEKYISIWEEEQFYPALSWYAIIKAQSCFLKNDMDCGLEYLEKHVHTTANEVIMFPKIRIHFIRAILLLGKGIDLSQEQKTMLNSDLDELNSYIKASPSTFRFEKLLLKAEVDKEHISTWDKAKEYDLALNHAKKMNNPFYTAIASLCASRFWKELQYKDMYNTYNNEAIIALNQWGAYAASKRLKTIHKPQEIDTKDIQNCTINSSYTRPVSSNYKSILKSFNSISKSKDNKELLSILMQTILENATASSATLILKDIDDFIVKVQLNFNDEKVKFINQNISDSDLIPIELIKYSINSGENLIIQNPYESGNFQYDSYIKSNRPALCVSIPMKLEDSVKGVLYIENSEITTILSDDTIKTIEFLLTQAAIIYKNTTLYEALKVNDENLNKAQELLHVGSWQFNDHNGKIKWSAETYRIFDLEPFSCDIDYTLFSSFVHPDDASYVSKAAEQALSKNSEYNVKHRIVTAKGEIKHVHQIAEVYDENGLKYMSGTIQDISASHHAQEQISQLTQAIEQNPFSTIVTDINANIEYVNKKCIELTGYKKEDLIGSNMSIFNSGKHNKSFYEDLWDTVKAKKSVWKGTIIDKTKNSESIDFESTISPIFDERGEIINFVAVQEDVTQKNIKEKIFLIQTRQAQMGEMISMIAHQWRQPLSTINALITKELFDIELNTSNIDELRNTLTNMEDQVQYLSHTITDFREFFKPDKEAVLTDSATIVDKALKLILHPLEVSDITVNVIHNSESEYKTFENELVQVILNILKNSNDAFKGKDIEYRQIQITTDMDDKFSIISVEDNAGGVAESIIDKVFLPYTSTKNKQNGTGIGLYMSKSIVENHCKGSIDVSNTDNGAKFTIKLPLNNNLDIGDISSPII